MSQETTDATGKATFDVAYGDYTVTIEKDGYVTKTEDVAFRSNHKNFSIELVEDSGTTNVEVTTVDGEDTPLQSSALFLLTKSVTDPNFDENTDILGMGVTDENGVGTIMEFEIDSETHQPVPTETPLDVDFGTYYVFARNGATLTKEERITVDATHNTFTMTLDTPKATVTFTCQDVNGDPITNGGGQLIIDSVNKYTSTIQSDGTITFTNVEFDEYDVNIMATDWARYVGIVDVNDFVITETVTLIAN